jgi:hypothetical protein
MVQFFKGQLASMYMLTGNTEQQSKIECLYKKAERVHFESTGQLASGETASFNNDHTELRLKANSLEDLSLLLQEVEFSIVNRKPAAAIGTYSLSASGIMSCQPDAGNKNAAFNRSIPSIEREIKVNVKTVSPKISISITGQSILNSDRKNLKAGAFLLPDVQITITEGNIEHLDEV